MSNKQARERFARERAAELARIALRLQRAPADQIDKLLRRAHECLQNYRAAKGRPMAKPAGPIDDAVSADLEAPMRSLGEVIKDTIKPHHYCLLIFDAGEDGDRLDYVSDVNRDDICQAMREFVAAHEEGKFGGDGTPT